MPHWITTEKGNAIDLDWAEEEGKSVNDYLRDYYRIQKMTELHLPKEEYAKVMSNINDHFYHQNKKYEKRKVGVKAIDNYVYVFKIGRKFNSQVIVDKMPIMSKYDYDDEG